jgi:hypothetical protein
MNDRNEADRILTEDWMMPGHVLLVRALEAHPERELIKTLQMETDERRRRRWSLGRLVEADVEDRWVEIWLLPWPHGRPEERPSIKVGTWPLQEAELDPLADVQAIIEEHDDSASPPS